MALQSFDHRASPYERPNQPWVCGRLAEGRPCRKGPSSGGRCQSGSECEPRRVGDRWQCTRSTNAGGACAEGPFPNGQCCHTTRRCVPTRSIRSRRGRVTRWLAIVVIGAVTAIVGGANLRPLLSPGQLSFGHAVVNDCSSCHASFAGGPVGWVHTAFAAANPSAEAKLCTTCHALGDQPLSPHSLAATSITILREAAHADERQIPGGHRMAIAAALFPISDKRQDNLACRTCHTEHQGRAGVLTHMDDGVCQSCHFQKFESLADGHPEFNQYPYDRRTRIIFDHAGHFNRHFAEARAKGLPAPADCDSCHTLEPTGKLEDIKPFDQACAACHLDDIRGVGSARLLGEQVIMVPRLDLKTLAQNKLSVGEWPAGADDSLTRIMQLLLAGNRKVADDLATLGAVSLGDLSKASPEQLAAAQRVAWAIKDLIYDSLTGGVPTLEKRLDGSLGGHLVQSLKTNLLYGMPQQVLLDSAAAWFPHLLTEIPKHRAGELVPMQVPPGLEAEARTAAPAKAPAPPTGNAAAKDQSDILGGDNTFGQSATAPAPGTPSGENQNEDQSDILSDGGDTLSGNPAPGGSKDQGNILGSDDILGGSAPLSTIAPAPTVKTQLTPAVAQPTDAESWAIDGGWYRIDYAIYYRPASHEDPFMHAWLDVSAPHDISSMSGLVFLDLVANDAPGQCAKCHSVDQIMGSSAHEVNWEPRSLDPSWREFTNFVHAPHVGGKNNEDCQSCHDMNEKADVLSNYKQDNPYKFVPGFEPLGREVCASCHVKGRANAACTDCHNYHVGRFARGDDAMIGRNTISSGAD